MFDKLETSGTPMTEEEKQQYKRKNKDKQFIPKFVANHKLVGDTYL